MSKTQAPLLELEGAIDGVLRIRASCRHRSTQPTPLSWPPASAPWRTPFACGC